MSSFQILQMKSKIVIDVVGILQISQTQNPVYAKVSEHDALRLTR